MLARIGPVKPFLPRYLNAHSEPCGRAEDGPPTRSRCARKAGAASALLGEPGRAKGTHRDMSAVSAEIVGGTLPEKRFSLRCLRHNVPVQHVRVGRETARAEAEHTGSSAG
jgi:hypothetical protein